MFSLFKKAEVVDAETSQNIRECFDWAINNFDRSYFYNSTALVQPTREYFPDRTDSEFAMAQALCKRILAYTGLSHWPFKVVAPQQFAPQMPALLNLNTQARLAQVQSHDQGQNAELNAAVLNASLETTDASQIETSTLEISYASMMMRKPMDLVGSMSKNIAQHYLYQAQNQYPQNGSAQFFDANAEIIAIFMGFGIFIANSAYTFRGSCAKCYDPRANRAAALSENEAIYCLALFCHYKEIPNKNVTPSLKGYLRSSFKRARAQVKRELNETED